MRIVLTGGTGFLGRALAQRLRASGHQVVLPLRQPGEIEGAVPIQPIEAMSSADWRPILAGADAVIHAAAIAHIGSSVPYTAYAAVNRDAAARLAEAAAAERIRRFIFISSIRAQCGATSDRTQTERTKPEPTEAYGRSKLQAEALILKALPTATILRPALIVGAEPKGNLKGLLRLARLPVPLPFGSLKAPQAMVSLEGMADAVALALVNDGWRARSSASLSSRISRSRRSSRRCAAAWGAAGPRCAAGPLLAFPLKLLGRGDIAERLRGGLSVDSAKLAALGWKPARGSGAYSRESARRAVDVPAQAACGRPFTRLWKRPRPSVPPTAGSIRFSGCGIMPSTLRRPE